ncbi:MAG: hypothetical protein WCL14_02210 [Bacteroidota bacterium]
MKNILILFAALALLTSCGKDGAPGAQGPAGNANVQSFVYNTSTWGYNSLYNYYYADLPVPEINNSVINGGTVQVFEGDQQSGSTNWYALPYSFNGHEVSYLISYGNVRVEISKSNGTVGAPSGIYQYKVVVIPPI